jgi:hypothetical protein
MSVVLMKTHGRMIIILIFMVVERNNEDESEDAAEGEGNAFQEGRSEERGGPVF